MLKLIHAADLHLDSPFAGLAPEQAARRREEQRALPEKLADLAREEGAELVLLSGDVLDGDRVYRETAQTLAAALGRIPCPVFLAPGNHDPYTARSLYAQPIWPENVHIFTSPTPERVDLPGTDCAVWGAAFTREKPDRSPLAGFRAPEDGKTHIMTLHANVGGTDYGPITAEDIARSGLAYLALGHVHQASGLQRAGGTYWAYPGCPEGRGFDETGEKGALAVTVDENGVTAEFRPLCLRRYEVAEVDLTDRPDALAAAEAALPARTERDVYRLILKGQYAMGPGEAEAVRRALEGRFYALEVRDNTRMPRDLWARAGEDSLTGLFLRAMQARLEGREEDAAAQLAARYGLAALEHGEDVSP